MASKTSIRLRTSDPKGIQKKLLGDSLYRNGLRDIVMWGTPAMAREARKRAPGTLGSDVISEIRHTTSKGGFGILQGRVRVRQRTNKGFRFPQALNYSKKIKGSTKRYRHGDGPRRGKLTKGWLTGARSVVSRELRQRVNLLSEEIQLGWAHG